MSVPSAILLAAAVVAAPVAPATAADDTVTIAVIGDFGVANVNEQSVATLVAGWAPDYVVTTGDDYCSGAGGSGTDKYDISVGRYYCAFLAGAAGGTNCDGSGSASNRFLPSTGNHDYTDAGIGNYAGYFALPSNERYYRVGLGPVDLFVIDSQAALSSSGEMGAQQSWLQGALAGLSAPWQVIAFHHPPYSSRQHGSSTSMRWPFATWGADLVLNGYDHTYERIAADGIVYVVDGLGGASRYSFGTPVAGGQVRYNANFGALRLVVTATSLSGTFLSIGDATQDTFSLSAPPPDPIPGAFGKSSPKNGAGRVSRPVKLRWGVSTGATGYEYCLDGVLDGACGGSWVSVGGATQASVAGLLAATRYEWQVRARNAAGTSGANGGAWWRFTTRG